MATDSTGWVALAIVGGVALMLLSVIFWPLAKDVLAPNPGMTGAPPSQPAHSPLTTPRAGLTPQRVPADPLDHDLHQVGAVSSSTRDRLLAMRTSYRANPDQWA